MIFREATKEDFDYLANHSISRGSQKSRPEQVDYCYTLEHEGVPLMTGGFRMINQSTAWCWVNMSAESGKHTAAVYRVIKEWIALFAKDHNIKRLQSYVEYDFDEGVRMVKHLGFEKESVMESFVGDKPAFMFVRIL